jgi:hypothetical protein
MTSGLVGVGLARLVRLDPVDQASFIAWSNSRRSAYANA